MTVSSSLVLLSPLLFPMFSHECIFNSIAIFLSVLTALPQSAKGIRARLFYPPLANRTEKWATVSSSLVLLFPLLFPMLSHGCIFKLIAILLSALTALPQSATGISLPLLSPARKSHREAGDGAFVSCLAFPPSSSQCFLTGAFPIQLLFCCRC